MKIARAVKRALWNQNKNKCSKFLDFILKSFSIFSAKTEARLNVVRKDTENATAESKEALERIQQRFFDDILFPKLIVKGIRYE